MKVERSQKATPKELDGVHDYAKDTLVLGLLFMEFNDSIREGDGDRIIRCWKFYFHCLSQQDVPTTLIPVLLCAKSSLKGGSMERQQPP